MYVSIHLSPQSRGDLEDLGIVEEIVEQAVQADAAGIAAICLTEHHLGGFNTYCDPFVMGAYLAGKLDHAYLAIHIVQVPLQHPMRIAEHANLLDLLMKGRLMVGLAPGSLRQIELDVFGVDVEARSQMTRQRIDAMVKAWGWHDGDRSLDVSTDYDGGVLAARLTPSSYRKPHPLIGRATMTDATIVETAKRGWPVILGLRDEDDDNRRQATLYRETLERSDHGAETARECLSWLGFVSLVCVAATEREAKRRVDEFAEIGGVGPIATPAVRRLGRAAGQGRRGQVDWKSRQLRRAQVALAGTPEMVVEHLLAYRDVGVDHARVNFIVAPGRHEQNMDSFRLFLEEVLPHLDAHQLPDPARTVLSEAEAGIRA